MANLNLFQSFRNQMPTTDTQNSEHAPAYSFTNEQALAQYALTGCLRGTYYATSGEQLEKVLQLCAGVDAEFVAKTAIYSRKSGYMKDMPALLCAVLASRNQALLETTFKRVIDNGRMLRNFVQIIRSGKTGRKSLGSAPRRLVRNWIANRSDEQLFGDAIGQSPSLKDIIRMVHPKPGSASREAMHGYLLGRDQVLDRLPDFVRKYEDFRSGRSTDVPDVPFQMLSNLPLGQAEWSAIALAASWQTTRMNLNTFARRGVFESSDLIDAVAKKLSDPVLIAGSRVFPYQLMVAFANCDRNVPEKIRTAIQEAMEIATSNVPTTEGPVYVCPDVSGSMKSPVTGRNKVSSAVRCVDVAGLIAATVLRKNDFAQVLPFDDQVREVRLNPRDSIMTNAQRLAALGGGGTSISAPIARMNQIRAKASLVVIVSDNQSWVDARKTGTQLMTEWSIFRRRNPGARLACLDIQPYGNTQAMEREDILNIGGFSDQVFNVIRDFAENRLSPERWVGEIKRIPLE